MTHKDIYEKFMIEYDKANITSSYPSLTKYEVLTLLDKAYQSIISQKITGRNGVQFESDAKASEDLRPLITTLAEVAEWIEGNEYICGLPLDYAYFVSGIVDPDGDDPNYVNLVSHNVANKFRVTGNNYPWIDSPVAFFGEHGMHILADPEKDYNGCYVNITYIRQPRKFTDNVDITDFELSPAVAEQLVSTAILFAVETTESPRTQTKSQLMPLEL